MSVDTSKFVRINESYPLLRTGGGRQTKAILTSKNWPERQPPKLASGVAMKLWQK
jgi:hypothetical protein